MAATRSGWRRSARSSTGNEFPSVHVMRGIRGTMIALAALLTLLFLGVGIYLQHPRFGAAPDGERLRELQRSAHYVDGTFRNLVDTRVLRDGVSMPSIIAGFLLQKVDGLRPGAPLPTVKTDLKALDTGRDAIVWLGHSSYFVVFAGQRILIDPVLSTFAAPVSFSTRAFEGTSLYTADDFPQIDVLLVTHDHWDHLDHDSVTSLEAKVSRVIVPLGVSAHFERWGYSREILHEADWYGKLKLNDELTVHVVPARHYSGRLLDRNKTLWAGFVLESPKRRILFGGDTGYGPHFKELARRFGPFDLAALDMGQYDARWPDIHMTPEEASQAAEDLQARALLPAHVGRFNIARHAWNDPFERITAASIGKPYRLLTPRIGESVSLDDQSRQFARWWGGAQRIAASAAPERDR